MSRVEWRHTTGEPVSMFATDNGVVVWSEQPETEPSNEIDAARLAAWGMMGIPRNADAALLKAAQKRGLGAPLTTEFDFTYGDRHYRGQGFAMGITFAEVGHWEQVWSVLW